MMLLANQSVPGADQTVLMPEDFQETEITETVARDPSPAEVPVLPTGTRVTLFLNDELTSREAQPGDLFPVTVLEDVKHEDITVIPAGAKGFGEVRFAKKKGAFGRAGLLDVSLRHVELCDGDVSIRGRYRQEGKGNNGAVVATWVAVGVFSGFITGKRGIMPDGQEFKARTAEDIDAVPCSLEQMNQKLPEAENGASVAASNSIEAVDAAPDKGTLAGASIENEMPVPWPGDTREYRINKTNFTSY